jgi:hypothetical protein
MYRPHETPRKPGSTVMWASAETSEVRQRHSQENKRPLECADTLQP